MSIIWCFSKWAFFGNNFYLIKQLKIGKLRFELFFNVTKKFSYAFDVLKPYRGNKKSNNSIMFFFRVNIRFSEFKEKEKTASDLM